jgi:acyl dehydratase
MESAPAGCLRFSPRDLEQFAAASGDRNPLHLSTDYARRTPWGQPVVFGVLSALGSLAHLAVPPQRRVGRLELDFARPVFAGVDYRVVVGPADAARASLQVCEGSDVVVRLRAAFVEGAPRQVTGVATRSWSRESAAHGDEGRITAGSVAAGAYWPDMTALAALVGRLDVDERQIGVVPLATLAWSSYLSGMELPGERSLVLALQVSFGDLRRGGEPPFRYDARVSSRNRLDMIGTDFRLTLGGESAAAGRIRTLLRPAIRTAP